MKPFDLWLERHWRRLYWALVLGALGLYALLSLKEQVWADEAYTFALIRHSFPDIWRITAADVHPPLYYFLMKLLAAPFAYNIFLCRLLSAAPCVLVMALAGPQLRRLFGTRTALLFMALYLMYPYGMSNATEVRMYGLSQLFVALCAVYAYRAWLENSPKNWALFALFGTCAAYTHYFALVAAGLIYALLLAAILRKKRALWKPWALAAGGTVLLFLPWLGSFVSQLAYKVSNDYWIEPITLSTLVGYVTTLFSAGGMSAFRLFFCLCYAAALVILLTKPDRAPGLLALAVPLGTLAVGLAASILVRPVFVIRYLLPCLPLMVFFFAYTLGRLRSEALLSALMTVCVMGGISNSLAAGIGALTPDEDRINTAFLQSLPEREAYLTLSGQSLHISQEISYYDSTTPIYTVDPLGADNPYPNRLPYAHFQPEDYETVLLVLEAGDPVPEALSQCYTCTWLGEVDCDGTHHVWYLERN